MRSTPDVIISKSTTEAQSYNQFSFILKIDFSLSRPQSRSVCRKAVILGDDGESNPMDENRVQGNGFWVGYLCASRAPAVKAGIVVVLHLGKTLLRR